MKKILVLIAFLLVKPFWAQESFMNSMQETGPSPGFLKKQGKAAHVVKTAGGIVSQRFDPCWSVLLYHGQANSDGVDPNNIARTVSAVYMDSTVKRSAQASGTAFVNINKIGMTFDPQSVIFDPDYAEPLFDKKDIYYLDTVWIGGIYRAIHPSTIDTLIIELVWGDTANTNVYTTYNYTTPPLSTWGRFATPNFNSSTQNGDACYLSAPATNRKVIRRAITPADTIELYKHGYLPIVVNGASGLQLKGSELLSVMYTYKPGSKVPFGSVVYNAAGVGPDPQTENGFATVCYQQNSPTLTGPSSYAKYFDDPSGLNYGIILSSNQRYGRLPDDNRFKKMAVAQLVTAFWMDFSIHGTSTVGIKSYKNAILSLGQNIPNPAIDATTVHYTLKSNAKDVKLSLTDLMGHEVYTEAIGSKPSGDYSVNIPTADLAAGVYYYSLQVDGTLATKKMIISK